MDIHLPTGENDTLGGLIFSQLGRVPDVGDEVQVDNVHLGVLSMHGRRIGKVRIRKDEPRPAAKVEDTAHEAAPETAGAEGDEDAWQTTRKVNGTA